jgi:hypothetical protein
MANPILSSMGQFLKRVITVNFVAAGFGIFIWIAYGFLHGLPLAEDCLGIRAELSIPVWLDCSIVAAFLLLVFFVTKKDWRQRVVIGAAGAWGLIWISRLPILLGVPPSFLGSPDLTLDRIVGAYACVSALLYGIIGPPRVWPFTPLR